MTPLETRLRSLRQPGRSAPSPGELRRRSAARGRRRLFTAAAIAVPFIAVALAVFVAADPGDPKVDRDAPGAEDPGRFGSGVEADGLSGDAKLFAVARLASTAAYEVQVETELAVLFSATKDDADRTAWEAQAPATDEAIADLREATKTIDADELDSSTRSGLLLIERTADSPTRARSIVGGGVTGWPSALDVYLAISKSFVDVGLDLANSTSDPQVNLEARSWAMALQLEADIAQQRAMLTGVFALGSFGAGDETAGFSQYDALDVAVESEANHSATLEDFGEAGIVKKIRDARSGNDVTAADDDRQKALDGADGRPLDVTVDVWRVTSGKKLDRVHDVQVEVAESISASIADTDQAGSTGTTTDGDERPFIAGAVLLGVLAIVLAFFVGRRTGSGGRRGQPRTDGTT